jgi:hypothetical protein
MSVGSVNGGKIDLVFKDLEEERGVDVCRAKGQGQYGDVLEGRIDLAHVFETPGPDHVVSDCIEALKPYNKLTQQVL